MTDTKPPDWIQEALNRADEPLDDELQAYVSRGEHFDWPMLRHPLVYQIPFIEQTAFRANDQFRYKKTALEKAVRQGEWSSAVYLHERPYRAQALDTYSNLVQPDGTYWDLVGDVYCDTENFWQESARWAKLLGSKRGERDAFMMPEEREHLAGLPDQLTIYRGVNGRGKRLSWAWTLDRDKAVWFAERLAEIRTGRPPTVFTATAEKHEAIGYLGRRGESEIVVPPSKLIITRSEKV